MYVHSHLMSLASQDGVAGVESEPGRKVVSKHCFFFGGISLHVFITIRLYKLNIQ